IVHREVHQVAFAVADVTAAVLDPFGPGVEIKLAVEMDVAAAQADALAVDAREIGLAANAAAVAAVQRVIPDVQLPNRRRVHGGDETAGIVRDIHEILVGADARHARHHVVGQLANVGAALGRLQAPAAVRETDDAALRLGPAEYWQVPRRPILDHLGDFLV